MRTVVITGVSRGIGRAAARRFLAEGWRVIGTSTSGAVEYAHENLTVMRLDLADPAQIDGAASRMLKAVPAIDALINNAGILIEEDLDEYALLRQTLEKTLQVNLIGLIDLTERLLAHVAPGGRIISVSSDWGSMCEPRTSAEAAAYSISKAALGMYTRVLSVRLAARGVSVAALDPGWVKTDMGGDRAPRRPEEPANELFSLATMPTIKTGHLWRLGAPRSW